MSAIATAKAAIRSNIDALAERYWAREDVAELIAAHTQAVDETLIRLFNAHLGDAKHVALVAVGGYGRGELHPGSDLDLLILAKAPQKHREQIAQFHQEVYDLNLDVGFATRTAKECKAVAAEDITVATALMERRLLAGEPALVAQLDKALNARGVWPSDAFYRAKRDEQDRRHARFDNVDYGLEPNVKSSPGGLRDYQTAMWVCLRHFGTSNPEALVELGVLTEQEKQWLVEGRRFLWWVRFGLHLLAGRKEDRLQFEHQRELARRLGYADTQAQRGVERFMHAYYRHVGLLREVNDILLQHFDEHIFSDGKDRVVPLNERFQLRGDYIEAIDDDVFRREPHALIELFVVMANRKDVAGVRANTIRLIRDHLHLIDDDFRADKRVNEHFINLLKAPYMLVSTLTRMRRYGVLGRYIPEFGRVTGQMQHDLFHIYTVDAHTMTVIRNMRRFFYRSSAELFPVASHCVKKLPKIELLYISGLFHDIAKGRGGDHSELGADEVTKFCTQHGLNEQDTELVRWLVEKHLYMSSVAQREDIYDPDVVQAFAEEVKSERRLDYLYTLTVADINATNPTLWNSYRATLLRHLHGATRRALRRGLEAPLDKEATVLAARESVAEKILARKPDLTADSLDRFLQSAGDELFLRHSPRHIANVAMRLMDQEEAFAVWVSNVTPQVEEETFTEIYLYTQDREGLFASAANAIDQLGLSIFEANINTDVDGTCFNTYVVLDRNNDAIDPKRHAEVRDRFRTLLDEDDAKSSGGRMSRQEKQLSRSTEVTIRTETGSDCSQLMITASDRPGLLAAIGNLFRQFGVRVQRAKINTLGDRVEDLFDIQTPSGAPYSDGDAYELSQALRQALDWELQRAL